MMNIFNSAERSAFYENSGIPIWNATYENIEEGMTYPYALYTCLQQPTELLDELSTASVHVANAVDVIGQRIHDSSMETLNKYGYENSYASLLELPWDKLFCFRIGWGRKNGQLKLLEINTQTPGLFMEAEKGNPALASHFGLQQPFPGSLDNLKNALNQSIADQFQNMQGAHIGFVSSKSVDEKVNINYLASLCNYSYEAIPITQLDFRVSDNKPFSLISQRTFDALILWYPLEWLHTDSFKNGEPVWPLFMHALQHNTFKLIHALPAFFLQSKGILAYATEHADSIFQNRAALARRYFPATYLDASLLGNNYCAKPMWGREGRGAYIIRNGEKFPGRYQGQYYTGQQYVYQELLELPTRRIEEKDLTMQYESWVYRVAEQWVPGSTVIRATEHPITDDFSYWVPIGR